MKVNIICNDNGWIYDQFIEAFRKYSKNTIVRNSKVKCSIVHFLPYYTYYCTDTPTTAWMSHQEHKNPLRTKFIDVAKSVDVAISHSNKYANMLRNEYELDNVVQIIPGIYTNKFKLRSVARNKNDKLVVGYIGRAYTSSNRKNPALLNRISKLPFVDFRTTGGSLKLDQVPQFYKELDVVISAATIEGGPISVQEGLSCGVPIVCMKNVGVSGEFEKGILLADDDNHFIRILKDMHTNNDHIDKWRDPKMMSQIRAQVENQTWKRFVEEHDNIWQMINTKSWKESCDGK